MNKARLAFVLAAGLAFMPVTKAGEYKDGAADELAQLADLQIPKGATVWLDLEGVETWETGKTREGKAKLRALIEGWAAAIVGAGYTAGLYVGAPQPFTGAELYSLKGITRYWLGQGHCVGIDLDQGGKIVEAYPKCGWCMRQDWHNETEKKGYVWKDTGVLVDTNAIQFDHFGRIPSWVVA